MPAGPWLSVWSYSGVNSLKRPTGKSRPSSLVIADTGFGMTWLRASARCQLLQRKILHSSAWTETPWLPVFWGGEMRGQGSNHIFCLLTLNPLFSAVGCPLPHLVPPNPRKKQILTQGVPLPPSLQSLTCSIFLDFSRLQSVAQLLGEGVRRLYDYEYSYNSGTGSSPHTSSHPLRGSGLEVEQDRVNWGLQQE